MDNGTYTTGFFVLTGFVDMTILNANKYETIVNIRQEMFVETLKHKY